MGEILILIYIGLIIYAYFHINKKYGTDRYGSNNLKAGITHRSSK